MAGRASGGRSQKRRRLSRSAEFERVYRQGRSKSNRFFVLYAFARGDQASDDGPRLGVSVSRKVGSAVDRTHVKRLLREAFWAEAERLPKGSDYVVVARPDARELAEREGMAGVRGSLAELADMLGGLRLERARDRGAVARPEDRGALAPPDDPAALARPDDPAAVARPNRREAR